MVVTCCCTSLPQDRIFPPNSSEIAHKVCHCPQLCYQDLFCCHQHTRWAARHCKEAVKIFWAGNSLALCIESGRQCFLWTGNAGAQFVFNLFNVFSPQKLSNLSLKESGEFVSAKNRWFSSATKADKLVKEQWIITRKQCGAKVWGTSTGISSEFAVFQFYAQLAGKDTRLKIRVVAYNGDSWRLWWW